MIPFYLQTKAKATAKKRFYVSGLTHLEENVLQVLDVDARVASLQSNLSLVLDIFAKISVIPMWFRWL